MTVSDNDKCIILEALLDFRVAPRCLKTTRPDPTVRPKDDGKKRPILIVKNEKNAFCEN